MYREIVKNMTLEEKVGQMLCLAYLGTEYDDQMKSLIEKYKIGTIILFSRNIIDLEQVHRLNTEIHKHSKYPMFIGLDHEGGMVRRVMNDITYLPGAMALYNANDEELYSIYNQVGKELRQLGFNMNYMPTVDVNNNPFNPVINSRSYSDNPDVVSQKSIVAVHAMQDACVLPTPKHFPGHGNTNVDSHVGLPVVELNKDELYEVELKPFQEVIKAGTDGIMISHILYKKLDEVYPATLSKNIITDLLKKEMGYENLIITDSLTMAAIYQRYPVREIIKRSINAGNDIIMFCGEANDYEQELIFNEFVSLVKNGEIPMERIEESVLKVMRLKEKYKVTIGNNCLDKNTIKENFNVKKELSEKLTEKSVTLYKENGILPLKATDKVLSLFPKINLVTLVDNSGNNTTTIGKLLNCDEIIYDKNNTISLENIVQKSQEYDKIILATYNVKADDYQSQLFKSLDPEKVICVALRSPYDILQMPKCGTYICTYDCTNESIKALCNDLVKNQFSVKLPVNLNIKGEK